MTGQAYSTSVVSILGIAQNPGGLEHGTFYLVLTLCAHILRNYLFLNNIIFPQVGLNRVLKGLYSAAVLLYAL